MFKTKFKNFTHQKKKQHDMNVYTKNINGNIVIINNDRYSLRCRQRGINIDGSKVKPF